MAQMTQPKRVVVGVDDSATSRRALSVAFDEARSRSAPLVVVCVYEPAPVWPQSYGQAPEVVARKLGDYIRTSTETLVHEVLGERLTEAGAPPVDIVAVPGRAEDRLVEAARGSGLLVLGSRGHGRFRSAVSGSVGLHCAVHAECPVMVVGEEAVTESIPEA